MGIAIIGTGAIAEVHAKALTNSGVLISAVSGVDQLQVKEFADRFGIKSRYQDSKELLENQSVTSVIIATPSQFHSQYTLEALEQNKPVLCEVPLAMKIEAFELVQKTAQERNVLTAVAQTLRYSLPHMRLKEILSEVQPETLNISVRNFMFRQENIGWTGVKRSWVDSVLWHHGSHSFDLAIWLLGATSFDSLIYVGPIWSNGQVMDVSGLFRTESGQTATVNLSYHSRISHNDVVVITETDTFEISQGRLTRNGELLVSPANGEESLADSVRRQDLAFIKAVDSGDLSEVISVDDLEVVYRLLARA
jgi:predicted dehydrogenase